MKLIMDAAKMVVDSRFSGRDSWDEMKEAIAVLADAIDHDKSIAMEAINDGGPAFPTAARDGNWQPHCDGMSLRDWFAGMALQGCLAGRNNCSVENPSNFESMRAARECYHYADAMLAARKEGV